MESAQFKITQITNEDTQVISCRIFISGKLSDHGLEHLYAEDFTETEINAIFKKIRHNYSLMPLEMLKFKSATSLTVLKDSRIHDFYKRL